MTEVRQAEEAHICKDKISRAIKYGSHAGKEYILWAEVWRTESFRILFVLRSVYDTLSSSLNVHQWGLKEEHSFKLCDKQGTMIHCQVALKIPMASQ